MSCFGFVFKFPSSPWRVSFLPILQPLPCLDAFEEGKTFARLGVSPLAIPFTAASKPESCFIHTVGTVPQRTVSPGLAEDTVRDISGVAVLGKLLFLSPSEPCSSGEGDLCVEVGAS